MKILRPLIVVALTAAVLAVAPAAHAVPVTQVNPGDQLLVRVDANSGQQCTANFAFSIAGDTTHQYIGLAAHCFGNSGDSTATNGCLTTSYPLGQEVDAPDDGNTSTGNWVRVGQLYYSSWLTMLANPEDPGGETCQYNDLAIVQLDPGITAGSTVPTWGGPTGLAPAGAAESGRKVYTYGNSSTRQNVRLLSPKTGTGVEDSPGGWEHYVQTPNPGIPGDSGSGFMDDSGNAMGVLSTLGINVPGGVVNGVGDLGRELAYANAHGVAASLRTGTKAFNPTATITASLGI